MRTFIILMSLFVAAGCDSAGDRETYTATLRDGQGIAIAGFELDFEIPRFGAPTTGAYIFLGASGERGVLRVTRDDDGLLTISIDFGASDSGYDLIGRLSDGDSRIAGDWFELTVAGPRLAGTFVAERE